MPDSLIQNSRVLGARSIPAGFYELPGLPFCQDIGIPSFVLRLGFINNPDDRKAVEQNIDAIAEGIAKGLLTWGNSISPIPVPTDIDQPQSEILERSPSQQVFQQQLFRQQSFLSF